MDVLSIIGWHHENQCVRVRESRGCLLLRVAVDVVTPGGSDKTSVSDAAINHHRLQTE